MGNHWLRQFCKTDEPSPLLLPQSSCGQETENGHRAADSHCLAGANTRLVASDCQKTGGSAVQTSTIPPTAKSLTEESILLQPDPIKESKPHIKETKKKTGYSSIAVEQETSRRSLLLHRPFDKGLLLQGLHCGAFWIVSIHLLYFSALEVSHITDCFFPGVFNSTLTVFHKMLHCTRSELQYQIKFILLQGKES